MAQLKKRTWYRIFSFIFSVLIILGVLKLLNWVPLAIQKEDLRKYRTIEEVQARLQLREIFIPTYFPEEISWPPAQIFGQKKPFVLVIMHFMQTGTRNPVLSIYQTDVRADFEPPFDTDILYKKKQSSVFIKDRQGILETAVCRRREICNKLSWSNKQFSIILLSHLPANELLKIAESML